MMTMKESEFHNVVAAIHPVAMDVVVVILVDDVVVGVVVVVVEYDGWMGLDIYVVSIPFAFVGMVHPQSRGMEVSMSVSMSVG